MRNISMLTPIFFAFLAFSLCHFSIAISLPPYVADDNITVNCGSSGSSWDQYKRMWIGDIDSKFTPTEENIHKSITSTAQSQRSFDAVPYMTARLSYSQFTYVFRVTPGPKFVRLHFYPAPNYSANFVRHKDFFTVKAGSFTLLRNFSASILATYLSSETFYKEFCVNVEQDQKLNLTFIPSPSASNDFYAFINGIEIISMPRDLYYQLNGEGLPWIRQTALFYMKESMAFENVFRLNVGGSGISPHKTPACSENGLLTIAMW
ncbi:Receptor-like protein kinase FERONIA [Morella rubra]|uniref:Receptor-like protein kinase FERONIA n=1 Tax=Morella rubra TaxID=262757 RepID=A0A6A1VFR0_9ROSI|nr:Receptor-like protein kinase FERONIA [Morella rubra]